MNTLIDRKIEDKIVDYYAMAILLPKDEFYQMLMDNKYFDHL